MPGEERQEGPCVDLPYMPIHDGSGGCPPGQMRSIIIGPERGEGR
jgi:hypothetical protein